MNICLLLNMRKRFFMNISKILILFVFSLFAQLSGMVKSFTEAVKKTNTLLGILDEKPLNIPNNLANTAISVVAINIPTPIEKANPSVIEKIEGQIKKEQKKGSSAEQIINKINQEATEKKIETFSFNTDIHSFTEMYKKQNVAANKKYLGDYVPFVDVGIVFVIIFISSFFLIFEVADSISLFNSCSTLLNINYGLHTINKINTKKTWMSLARSFAKNKNDKCETLLLEQLEQHLEPERHQITPGDLVFSLSMDLVLFTLLVLYYECTK